MYYGALEAGGTKMVAAIGTKEGQIIKSIEIPTCTPAETMPKLLDFFKEYELAGMGVGAFGPVELHYTSDAYGSILNSPKKNWKGFSFYQYFKEALGCPVVVDTDVNGAALGEQMQGALKDIDNGLYLTVGTGVGAGIITNGKLLHGMLHPEAGHILIHRKEGDTVKSVCPFHTHCLEGLAAGPMLERRSGIKGSEIREDDPVWELESYYLAQALVNYTMVLSVERIVLGGGVMKQKHLFSKIRSEYARQMAGYVDTELLRDLEHYIVPAGLNGLQGIIGALYLGIGCGE